MLDITILVSVSMISVLLDFALLRPTCRRQTSLKFRLTQLDYNARYHDARFGIDDICVIALRFATSNM
jgi:hypothetical protein